MTALASNNVSEMKKKQGESFLSFCTWTCFGPDETGDQDICQHGGVSKDLCDEDDNLKWQPSTVYARGVKHAKESGHQVVVTTRRQKAVVLN